MSVQTLRRRHVFHPVVQDKRCSKTAPSQRTIVRAIFTLRAGGITPLRRVRVRGGTGCPTEGFTHLMFCTSQDVAERVGDDVSHVAPHRNCHRSHTNS